MEFYRHVLQDDFQKRKARNGSFSLRSYAKYLGLSPATLSGVLNSKRSLPPKNISDVAQKLDLDPVRKEAFLKSATKVKASLKNLVQHTNETINPMILNEQKDFNIIAQWEYFALLNLIETDSFQNDIEWIAHRLVISQARVQKVLTELTERGLILEEEGKLSRTHKSIETTRDVFSSALRASHKENFKLAEDKLETIAIEDRFYSASTLAIDSEKLDDAKELIREFREKISTFLAKDKKDEVYHFNIQLYPITNIQKNGEYNEASIN